MSKNHLNPKRLLSRRKLLIGGFSFILGAGSLVGALRFFSTTPTKVDLQKLIIEASPLSGSMTLYFGKTGRDLYPTITSEELLHKITQHWPTTDVSSVRKVRSLLRNQINQDFKNGQVTQLRGWFYSNTEVNIMVLNFMVLDAQAKKI